MVGRGGFPGSGALGGPLVLAPPDTHPYAESRVVGWTLLGGAAGYALAWLVVSLGILAMSQSAHRNRSDGGAYIE